ncbi:MAG: hypothetical protein KJ058_16655 [Thermoanaerobaculia bacterium]|nr:hypothetical protein [Thermoanaerobaculia bacterium]MCZ7649746.1 hypothetical protein [Thermoanaerobaculia bacterium]
MGRRLLALAVVAALALAGSVAFAWAARGTGSPAATCQMGRACPLASGTAARCPASPVWSARLGCCQAPPAAPAAPAPSVGCPLPSGGAGAPAVLRSAPLPVAPAPACPFFGRAEPRTAALHELGLFTLFSVLLI